MRRTFILLAALSSACTQRGSVVLVDVGAQGVVQNVALLRTTVTNAGDSVVVDIPLRAVSTIPPAQTFTLSFDNDRFGALRVSIDAHDSDGHVVASGFGDGEIESERATELQVKLDGVQAPDLGANDSSVTMTGVFVAGSAGGSIGGVRLDGRFYWQGSVATNSNGNVVLRGWLR